MAQIKHKKINGAAPPISGESHNVLYFEEEVNLYRSILIGSSSGLPIKFTDSRRTKAVTFINPSVSDRAFVHYVQENLVLNEIVVVVRDGTTVDLEVYKTTVPNNIGTLLESVSGVTGITKHTPSVSALGSGDAVYVSITGVSGAVSEIMVELVFRYK